jgi:hypothetical protein
MKLSLILKCVVFIHVLLLIGVTCELSAQNEGNEGINKNFQWVTGPPVLLPATVDGEDWVSVKDPSIIHYNDMWHLFITVRGKVRSHAVVYLSFPDWDQTEKAERHVLSCHPGYFCAPQVFYFSLHKKWYMIVQASDSTWNPQYQAAYSTTTDISDPDSWSPLQPLGANQADGKSGLDFWIICDEEKAHLFFTTLDGRLWREHTEISNFPHGWSKPELEIQGDIFEASHTYRIEGSNSFLTLVEAEHGHGFRYFKAYVADAPDGEWRPLAADKDNAFASMKNVEQTEGHWTDAISHGELLRSGYDEKLVVDEDILIFLFQGTANEEKEGKSYGMIPWKPGLLK